MIGVRDVLCAALALGCLLGLAMSAAQTGLMNGSPGTEAVTD